MPIKYPESFTSTELDRLSCSSRGRSTSRDRESSSDYHLSKHHYTPPSKASDLPESAGVHLNRYSRAYAEKAGDTAVSSIKLARVMYDFHALASRELSAKKDDIVIIRRPVNHNWAEVEDPQSGLKVRIKGHFLSFLFFLLSQDG